jgi:hypothetical protein
MSDYEKMDERYERMNPAERKRYHERIILGMVYDLGDFLEVVEQERPDFTIRLSGFDLRFGVEVTQMFPNESIARLNLLDGYMSQLFDGGPLRHRDDAKNLTVTEATVSDKDGTIKHENLRMIVTPQVTREQFRQTLAAAIRTKTGRDYDVSSLGHLNLIILDWFHLASDLSQYAIDTFLDDSVISALLDSPFREVYLVTFDTSSTSAGNKDSIVRPRAKVVPLQQLLLANRYFVTASAIDSHAEMECVDTDHLSRLASEHLVTVQQIGSLVDVDGLVCARYRGSAAGIRESGMVLYEYGDYSVAENRVEPVETFAAGIAADITQSVNSYTLNWSYARDARGSVPESDDL